MRKTRRLLFVAVALASSVGCVAAERAEAPRPGSARRIIALAPNVAEILFELELDERIVAVGDYVDWPPEAAAKPRVGGLFDPRLEDIVALEPDLAVVLPSEEKLASELGRLGIEVLRVEHQTLADLERAIVSIAKRTGVEARGRELVARLRRDLGLEGEETEPRGSLPGAVLVVAREPGRVASMTVVGSQTFLAELLAGAGGRNAFGDLDRSYAEVGLEELLRRQPEAIVELQPDELDAEARGRLVAEWAAFPELRAVASGCVAVIAGDHVLVPGPRLARLAGELEAALGRCDPQGGPLREPGHGRRHPG